MGTIVRVRWWISRRQILSWLPLFVLPALAVWISADSPAWGRMWLLAVSIYAGFKWLTFAESNAARKATWPRALGYLLLWIGMDAKGFFEQKATAPFPRWTEWWWAMGQMGVGIWLLVGLAPRLIASESYVAGWVAMTGVVSVLHFGMAHLLSVGWRSVGVNAQPIMDKPALARSVSDFWGRRWNLAFRDVMHAFVFRPLVPVIGAAWATVAVFVVSGLIHDAVISFTGRGGWGLPTLYFLAQAGAVFVERSRFGRRIGLGRGLIGWVFAAAVVVAPVGLLFHGPFVDNVVVPMVTAIRGVLS